MRVQLRAKSGVLRRIAALRQQYADLQFLDGDYRHIQIVGIHALGPSGDMPIGFAETDFPQLGDVWEASIACLLEYCP